MTVFKPSYNVGSYIDFVMCYLLVKKQDLKTIFFKEKKRLRKYIFRDDFQEIVLECILSKIGFQTSMLFF